MTPERIAELRRACCVDRPVLGECLDEIESLRAQLVAVSRAATLAQDSRDELAELLWNIYDRLGMQVAGHVSVWGETALGEIESLRARMAEVQAVLAPALEAGKGATPGPWGDYMGDIDQLTDAEKGYPLDYYPDSKTIIRCYGICNGDCIPETVIDNDADRDLITLACNAIRDPRLARALEP